MILTNTDGKDACEMEFTERGSETNLQTALNKRRSDTS